LGSFGYEFKEELAGLLAVFGDLGMNAVDFKSQRRALDFEHQKPEG
jgi:hypothetical protein